MRPGAEAPPSRSAHAPSPFRPASPAATRMRPRFPAPCRLLFAHAPPRCPPPLLPDWPARLLPPFLLAAPAPSLALIGRLLRGAVPAHLSQGRSREFPSSPLPVTKPAESGNREGGYGAARGRLRPRLPPLPPPPGPGFGLRGSPGGVAALSAAAVGDAGAGGAIREEEEEGWGGGPCVCRRLCPSVVCPLTPVNRCPPSRGRWRSGWPGSGSIFRLLPGTP